MPNLHVSCFILNITVIYNVMKEYCYFKMLLNIVQLNKCKPVKLRFLFFTVFFFLTGIFKVKHD